MLSLSSLTEPHFFLVSCYLECIPVVLVHIPAVTRDEYIEGIDEPALAARISKVKSLQVVDKGIRSKDLQGCDLTAIVLNTSRIELVAGSMRDHFFPAS